MRHDFHVIGTSKLCALAGEGFLACEGYVIVTHTGLSMENASHELPLRFSRVYVTPRIQQLEMEDPGMLPLLKAFSIALADCSPSGGDPFRSPLPLHLHAHSTA